MKGFSIFMSQAVTEQTVAYIEKMAKAGFEGMFTSINLPEDDVTKVRARLVALGELAKQNDLALMVDISESALKRLDLSFEKVLALKKFGITGLRADDGISPEMIAKLSKEFIVGLNASTLTAKEIIKLKEIGADFTKLAAWHNYYPRPETGLVENYFCEQNEFLKGNGLKINAFIAGDENLRYPLYQGLPTLENHRYLDPLVAWIKMKSLGVDGIYLGDPGLNEDSLKRLSDYFNEQVVTLRIHAQTRFCHQVLGEHENRKDVALAVIRSAKARSKQINKILPQNTHKRDRGSVTIDNCKYGRYMGEVQITKCDLVADPKVNVLGRVIADDLELLDLIGSGQKFKLMEEKQYDGSN